MAKKKNGENEENKKKKKGGKGLLIAILVPIIIVVLIAGFFLAIIEGILGILLDFINALLDFFSDPIGALAEFFRNVGNWFASWLGGDYSPPEPERAYMAVFVDDETVENIKEQVTEVAIDTNKAGLTDSVLKKIILAYYATFGTVDTLIYTPINEDEEQEIIERGERINPSSYWHAENAMNDISGNFIYFYGYGDDFQGDSGQLYMGTKGTVKPINANGTKLKYYDLDTFMSIAAEFDHSIESGDSDSYIDSFFDTFNKIYTVGEGASGSISVIRADTGGLSSGGYSEARTLDYREKISRYAMPIELLVNMLDITASPDFIDAVARLVESSSIVIRVNQTSIIEMEQYNVEYTLVEGETEYDIKLENVNSLKGYSKVTDFILTLDSVNCWYCNASFDTEEIWEDISTEPEDITDSFNFEEFLVVYHWWYQTGYDYLTVPENASIENKHAETKTIGWILTYSETTGTHTENIQPFIDILKTKFFDLYIDDVETAKPGDLLSNGSDQFFQLLEESPNTAQYVNVMKYILYRYSGIDYGVTSLDEVFELFDTLQTGSNYISPFGTDMSLEEFRDWVNAYNDGDAYSNLSSLADDFYNICQQERYNINPCLAFAWACVQTRNGNHIENNNLFGMATELGGSEAQSYSSPQASITAFCNWIIDTSTEGTAAYNEALAIAEEFAADDNKFGGNPHNNVYVLFINFPYVEPTPKTPEQRVQKAGTEVNRITQRAKSIFGEDCLLRSTSSLMEAAYQVADHFLNSGVNVHYAGNDVDGCPNNGRHCTYGNIQGSWDDPIRSPATKGVVCATFVSLSIWKAGLIDTDTINRYGYNACTGVADMLEHSSYASDWKKITNWNDLQEGDIVHSKGHIWIYVEGGKVIDQSYCVIRSSGQDERGKLGSASWYAGKFIAAYRYVGR